MKLYKFRSLGDKALLDRVKGIIDTGKFWCSALWELNDPMEGIYSHAPNAIPEDVVNEIFTQKTSKRLCSFSARDALDVPTMWGYYANGFKGIAIEIEISDSDVEKVKYSKKVAEWITVNGRGRYETMLKRVLTTKLTAWKHENEFRRIIDESQSGLYPIGKVTGLYIGDPYRNVNNADAVRNTSNLVRDYLKRVEEIRKLAGTKKVKCYASSIRGGKVMHIPLGR